VKAPKKRLYPPCAAKLQTRSKCVAVGTATLAKMKMHKIFLWALACLWSVGALAQWQWTDKDGRKVFSDRPPPADVPPEHILKRPNNRPILAVNPGTADDVPSVKASATPTAAPVSSTDKELEEKKTKAEAAEAAKKKAEDAKRAAARADNCTRAQRAKATYDSQRPIRQTNAQGELVILEANERAAEVRRIQSIIDADCKR
jgi:hypothetical protein